MLINERDINRPVARNKTRAAPAVIARTSLLVCVALLTVSCSLFRPRERDPQSVSPVPEKYMEAPWAGSEVPNRWWEAFEDPELNRLVTLALRSNTSLAKAAARLQQARALERKKGADRYPELNVIATRQHTEDRPTGQETRTWETYALGLALSYELDLWGRVNAAKRSASFDASATHADWETAGMTLSAEVAQRYFELIATRQTIGLLERQLETNQDILELMELRFNKSQATALDVLDQREAVARTESLSPPQKGREKVLIHNLNILLGRPPSTEMTIAARELAQPPPVPDTGLPADLLTQRPDIRAAWDRLYSADWGLAEAKADRMPAIKLSASGRYENDSAETLFDNWILNLAANLSAPLFDAGKRKAEVDRQKAIVAEKVADYRETTLTALGEVQDALSNEYAQAERLEFLQHQLELSTLSRKQALNRYGRGQESYLRVLFAMDRQESLMRSVVQAKYQLLVYRVQLYRALGGDWDTILAGAGQDTNGDIQ